MKQVSFSDFEYSSRKKKTKREEFLEIMDEIIPWDEWVALMEPYYPTGNRDRPTRMWRTPFMTAVRCLNS